MLRKIIVIFSSVLCLYLPSAHAEVPAVSLNQARQIDAAPKRGVLFKVSAADHTLFLFGTIHVGTADFYPLESTVMDALARASRIALEIDPLNASQAQISVMRYGIYPSAKTLPLKLPQKTRLTALLKARGLTYNTVATMKPWLAATVMTLNEFSRQGFRSEFGVDNFIAGYARANNKPLVELETIDAQLATFGTLTERDQLRDLDDTMAEIEDRSGIEKVTQLTRLWRDADRAGIDAMAVELAADPTFSGGFFQKVLLDDRNPGLASGIEKLLKAEANSFAGIGMFHLVGKQSVPDILQQRGYRVERVY